MTWDACVTCTVTAGVPGTVAAAEPRILKFSSTTGFTPVMLTAGRPPGGATIAERSEGSACAENMHPPKRRAPFGVVLVSTASVAGRTNSSYIASRLQLDGVQRDSA
jgi:hypothetical protein